MKALALIFALTISPAYCEETIFGWSCSTLKAYLSTHTRAEAYAKAKELHLPKWIITRAEKCK